MRRTRREGNQRQYWRSGRALGRGDWCCTALHSDLFERNNAEMVLEEIRRGFGGRLPRLKATEDAA